MLRADLVVAQIVDERLIEFGAVEGVIISINLVDRRFKSEKQQGGA
jgi:hypothetical protein